MLECRSCGAGAPVDEHFCPQCSRIMALGRHGDYFAFSACPDAYERCQDLEKASGLWPPVPPDFTKRHAY